MKRNSRLYDRSSFDNESLESLLSLGHESDDRPASPRPRRSNRAAKKQPTGRPASSAPEVGRRGSTREGRRRTRDPHPQPLFQADMSLMMPESSRQRPRQRSVSMPRPSKIPRHMFFMVGQLCDSVLPVTDFERGSRKRASSETRSEPASSSVDHRRWQGFREEFLDMSSDEEDEELIELSAWSDSDSVDGRGSRNQTEPTSQQLHRDDRSVAGTGRESVTKSRLSPSAAAPADSMRKPGNLPASSASTNSTRKASPVVAVDPSSATWSCLLIRLAWCLLYCLYYNAIYLWNWLTASFAPKQEQQRCTNALKDNQPAAGEVYSTESKSRDQIKPPSTNDGQPRVGRACYRQLIQRLEALEQQRHGTGLQPAGGKATKAESSSSSSAAAGARSSSSKTGQLNSSRGATGGREEDDKLLTPAQTQQFDQIAGWPASPYRTKQLKAALAKLPVDKLFVIEKLITGHIINRTNTRDFAKLLEVQPRTLEVFIEEGEGVFASMF